ncbi:hypothetical protein V8C37DRAFT_288607 [Trichoderma ceciliae]
MCFVQGTRSISISGSYGPHHGAEVKAANNSALSIQARSTSYMLGFRAIEIQFVLLSCLLSVRNLGSAYPASGRIWNAELVIFFGLVPTQGYMCSVCTTGVGYRYLVSRQSRGWNRRDGIEKTVLLFSSPRLC